MARDTLGAAVGVAAQLPDELGLVLLGVAREAFVRGMHLVSAISAVVAVGAAILVVVLLRHARAGSDSEDQAHAAPALPQPATPGTSDALAGD